MGPWLARMLKRAALWLGIIIFTLIALRTWDAQRGPPLEPWHRLVPHELSAGQIRDADWPAWLAAEDAVFEEVRREITAELPSK